MTSVPALPKYFRMPPVVSDRSIGVDRENRIIRGYIVAEQGETKSPGRAFFDVESLQTLAKLGNADPKGVKGHFQHPSASDDGLGKFTGRSKNFRVERGARSGRHILRADHHIDATAMETPPGGGKPYGVYLMDLAESDPGAFQSSVSLDRDHLLAADPDNSETEGVPLVRPNELRGVDFVREGDATHGELFGVDLMTEEGLDQFFEGSERRIPTRAAQVAWEYMSQMFPDSSYDVIKERLDGFRDRYLNWRFGSADTNPPDSESTMDQDTKEALKAQENRLEQFATSTDEKLSKLTDLIETDRKERKAEFTAQQRAAEINSMCELSGVAEKGEASKWIANDAFGVDDVRKILFERKCKQSSPPADDTEGDFSAGGGDPDTKYREDYQRDIAKMKRDRVTEFAYINWRRRKDNLEPHAKSA